MCNLKIQRLFIDVDIHYWDNIPGFNGLIPFIDIEECIRDFMSFTEEFLRLCIQVNFFRFIKLQLLDAVKSLRKYGNSREMIFDGQLFFAL